MEWPRNGRWILTQASEAFHAWRTGLAGGVACGVREEVATPAPALIEGCP